MGSGPGGLSSDAAAAALRRVGPNVIRDATRLGALRLLLRQVESPLVFILIFAAAISLALRQWVDSAIILAIVLGSSLLGFLQEYRASAAVEQLKRRLALNCRVMRDGVERVVPVSTVVPGDVVLLAAGNLIPADGVVIAAADFLVSEAAMTGESFPVEKRPGVVAPDAPLAARTNAVFLGASVQSGTAKVLVVETGLRTAFGAIAARLGTRQQETDFGRGVRHFGYLLIRTMVAIVLFVLLVNLLLDRPVIESLLFAVALAVGLSPELLPAIVSVTLSAGAREMSGRGVIVRRLDAIENLGSMDLLCTDKTGTLTEGVIRLDACTGPDGTASQQVRLWALLNATLQTGMANPLDEAIAGAKAEGEDLAGFGKVDEIPYDFVRKRLSIVVQEADGARRLITKGALDNVLAVCATVRDGDAAVPLDDAHRAEVQRRFAEWGDQGFRVLGVADRPAPVGRATRDDERDMTFSGFLLFFDPPKPDVEAAIANLARLGVRLKIITGDNRRVAEHVAHMVSLPVAGIVTGADLNAMRDEALWHAVDHADLFVEVDPNQKERIIRALQKTGHVVGYMGDGINDAPALHDADVGISVDTAVDVAREAADFVLLANDLDVLRRGIEEGRVTFANSLKYIFTTSSANFGNMFSMAGASLLLPFLPLLAKQILLNNFMADLPAIAIASDNVDRDWIDTPHRWDIGFIRRFMIVFGLLSSVFDYVTFGFLLFIVHASPVVFRTSWFVESLMTQLMVAMVVRTKGPFWKSRPGRWLLLATIAVAIVTLALPYLPIGSLFDFVPLPPWIVLTLLGITLLYVLSAEAAKRVFYRRSGTSLR
ncbi:MAG: magnesium-translocating P-type ATPase [Anaerolineae bacterium]|nr:magnesium-translocating P-type ATPase [Anaerolineae bacterium]